MNVSRLGISVAWKMMYIPGLGMSIAGKIMHVSAFGHLRTHLVIILAQHVHRADAGDVRGGHARLGLPCDHAM